MLALKAFLTPWNDDVLTMDWDEMKRRMRKAALKRLAAIKAKQRRARESQFSPEFGWGQQQDNIFPRWNLTIFEIVDVFSDY